MDTNDPRAGYEPGFAPWKVSAADYDFLVGLIDNEEETESDRRLIALVEDARQAVREGRIQID